MNEARLVVTQESSANMTDAHSDPKFMEFDLSDLFRTIPTCGTDGSDSAIGHLSVGGEHSYSKPMNMQSVELNEIGSNEHSYAKLGKNPKGKKQNKCKCKPMYVHISTSEHFCQCSVKKVHGIVVSKAKCNCVV